MALSMFLIVGFAAFVAFGTLGELLAVLFGGVDPWDFR